MRVKTFRGEGQRVGLRGERFPLPYDLVYFFPNIGDKGHVTSFDVDGSFRVIFLDEKFRPIETIIMQPASLYPLPQGTVHMAELSVDTLPIMDWTFLSLYA